MSDLGLHCLHMSHIKDAMLIWDNNYYNVYAWRHNYPKVFAMIMTLILSSGAV